MRPVARPLEFRERTEELERASLSTWATLAAETKGRDRHEDADPLRTVFQVDADRILGSTAFRALSGKRAWLPVGAAPSRMQETMTVARFGGLLARALRLNEDLVAAIAYGHALGSTPFAAAGEEALSAFIEDPYDTAAQSVRIVEQGGGPATSGLNLCWETRDGMLHHRWGGPGPATPEGQVVRVAVHVVGAAWPVVEALRDGRLHADDLPASLYEQVRGEWMAHLAHGIARAAADAPEVTLEPDVAAVTDGLAGLAEGLQQDRDAVADRHRAVHCLRSLAVYAVERHPDGPEAVVEVLQSLALATEAEVLNRFRGAFEPAVHGPLRE